MQTQKILLFPPTHEQSTPCFHVERCLALPFLTFLRAKGLDAWQPPEVLEKRGPDEENVVEISVEANTPQQLLEGLKDEFLSLEGSRQSPGRAENS